MPKIDRLTELNNLWKTVDWPFGTLLMLSVFFVTAHAFAKVLLPPNYMRIKISWGVLLAVSFATFGLILLTPEEIRWYAITLGLVWSTAFCCSLYVMRWLLIVVIQRSKGLGLIIWVASLALAFVTSVLLVTWSEAKFLGFMAGFGILGGVIGSKILFGMRSKASVGISNRDEPTSWR